MRGAVRELQAESYGFPGTIRVTEVNLVEVKETTTARPKHRRPAWWLLYAVLPLTGFLFWLADLVPATSGFRPVSELFATLMIFLAIALWLHANRLAMTLADYPDR